VLGTLLGAVSAHADPVEPDAPLTVIYRGPQVIPAAPFYRRLPQHETLQSTIENTAAQQQADLPTPTPLPAAVSLQSLFPLTSAQLQPSAPTVKLINALYRPFFILGTDEASLAWLQAEAGALKQIHAFGLVVEAPDWAAWLHLKSVAAGEGIALSLLDGDALATVYDVHTYPTLFTGAR